MHHIAFWQQSRAKSNTLRGILGWLLSSYLERKHTGTAYNFVAFVAHSKEVFYLPGFWVVRRRNKLLVELTIEQLGQKSTVLLHLWYRWAHNTHTNITSDACVLATLKNEGTSCSSVHRSHNWVVPLLAVAAKLPSKGDIFLSNKGGCDFLRNRENRISFFCQTRWTWVFHPHLNRSWGHEGIQ